MQWNGEKQKKDTIFGAIEQIKDKKYPKALEEYQGNLLLVGISYDKKTKEHKCKIEELTH